MEVCPPTLYSTPPPKKYDILSRLISLGTLSLFKPLPVEVALEPILICWLKPSSCKISKITYFIGF